MRGTSNSNSRGNTRDRLARRRWLLEIFRADRHILHSVTKDHGGGRKGTSWYYEDACRCWRCGVLLALNEITVDRIVPGCRGGRYVRGNIRPACARCSSEHGGGLRSARK